MTSKILSCTSYFCQKGLLSCLLSPDYMEICSTNFTLHIAMLNKYKIYRVNINKLILFKCHLTF